MADKKFYWLKLKQDFFEQDEIRIVEAMPNGKDYIIFLLKLQLKSINTEGHLLFKNAIPYSEEMLATLTNTNIDIVRSALKIFMQLRMVERMDNGTLFMTEVQNLIGSEGQSAERVRRFREKQEQALLCNSDVTSSNIDVIKSNEHIEKEKDKDKDKDKKTIYSENVELNQAILDFIQMRKKIKAEMSARAIALLLNNLNKLSTDEKIQIEIINQSILNSWKGVFPLKTEKNQSNFNNTKAIMQGKVYQDFGNAY